MRVASILALSLALAACTSAPGTVVSFELGANLTDQAHFFDFPYPSDLRLNANGGPELSGFQNPRAIGLVDGLKQIGGERAGFPVVPVAYFKFSKPIAARNPDDVIAAQASSPILLIDVDEASPDRGKLFPTVAVTPPSDDYVPDNVLAIAARPGFVLVGKRKYAFVVTRALGDAKGAPLGVAASLDVLERGGTPPGALGAAAHDSFAPLWPTLQTLGLDPKQIAAATVFTTGDVVA